MGIGIKIGGNRRFQGALGIWANPQAAIEVRNSSSIVIAQGVVGSSGYLLLNTTSSGNVTVISSYNGKTKTVTARLTTSGSVVTVDAVIVPDVSADIFDYETGKICVCWAVASTYPGFFADGAKVQNNANQAVIYDGTGSSLIRRTDNSVMGEIESVTVGTQLSRKVSLYIELSGRKFYGASAVVTHTPVSHTRLLELPGEPSREGYYEVPDGVRHIAVAAIGGGAGGGKGKASSVGDNEYRNGGGGGGAGEMQIAEAYVVPGQRFSYTIGYGGGGSLDGGTSLLNGIISANGGKAGEDASTYQNGKGGDGGSGGGAGASAYYESSWVYLSGGDGGSNGSDGGSARNGRPGGRGDGVSKVFHDVVYSGAGGGGGAFRGPASYMPPGQGGVRGGGKGGDLANEYRGYDATHGTGGGGGGGAGAYDQGWHDGVGGAGGRGAIAVYEY